MNQIGDIIINYSDKKDYKEILRKVICQQIR